MPKGIYDRSKAKKRHKHSPETIKKMSEARKKYYANMTYEEKQQRLKNFISVGKVNAIGRKVSDETRKKLAILQNGRVKSVEERQKLSRSLKGHIPWNKGRHWTEEEKDRIREVTIKSGRYGLNNVSGSNPTSIEIKVAEQLEEYGIKYVYQKSICNGHFILDFYLPEYQLVIECNGDYWHNRPERKERDLKVEKYVKAKGKDILWLWEHDINDEWFDLADYLEIEW